MKGRILELSTFAFSRQKAIINFRSGNPVKEIEQTVTFEKVTVENVLIVKC